MLFEGMRITQIDANYQYEKEKPSICNSTETFYKKLNTCEKFLVMHEPDF